MITIDGRDYGGWLEAGVRRALDRPASQFSFSGTDRWSEDERPLGLVVGAKCKVSIDGETVIQGHVDTIDSNYTSSGQTISVNGRSVTGDLVDCSVETAGDLRGKSVEQIARTITDPFGIEIAALVEGGDPINKHTINIGDSAWTVLQRLARMRGVILSDSRDGRLEITSARNAIRLPGVMRPGVVLSGAVRVGQQNRFSQYTVKAQQSGSDDTFGTPAAQPFGEVTDDTVGRYRPIVVVAERQANHSECKSRAQWERSTRSARGIVLTYVVQGHRANNDDLWDINRIIAVDDERLHVKGDFLIEAVEYRIGSSGETTSLSLVRPEAYTPEVIVEAEESLSFWERLG